MSLAQSNSKSDRLSVGGVGGGDGVAKKPTTFHDFLGNKGGQESAVVGGRPPSEVCPSAASGMGSERNVGNHLEGIPFYGPRGDVKRPESNSRLTGNKRTSSDSLMMSSRDKFPQDSQDSPLLTKLLHYSGGEQPREPHDNGTAFGVHQLRPIPTSFMSQSSAGGRADGKTFKRDSATTTNSGLMSQYPPRLGQVMPFGYQTPSNRFKDTNAGTSPVSQMAADEGSRTGIKGSGVLTSINARQPAGVLVRLSKQKPGIGIQELEVSTAPSQHEAQSSSGQMTIFYGGQAHVFDNVHPSKADVIMTLAGSNGGSWSTTYTPNPAAMPLPAENSRMPCSDNEPGIAALRYEERPHDKGDSH